MTRSRRLQTLSLILAVLVVLVDQLSKAWVEAALPPGVVRRWLPGVMDLQLVYNRGAAFSLFSGATTLLALISAAVAIVLVVWLLSLRQPRPLQLTAGALLLGGTVGNGLDRWRFGAVVDFLALVPIDFPVFNLADVAINLAVICFALDLLRRDGARQA